MTTDVGVERALRAGPRQWAGLAVLALPTLLLGLDVTVLNLAVPRLGVDLRPSGTELLWIVDIYGFMIAGFLITMGTLGDRIGRRRLLLIGSVAFGAASALAAYSTGPGLLIAARALLGIAGATLMPSTLALINNMFRDPRQRGTAIGVWMTSFSAGIALGPLIGGALLEHFWWGSVFLLGVPVMVLLLITAPLLLPEYRDPDAGRLDLVSVLLSLAAILPVIHGIKQLAEGHAALVASAAIVVGLAFGVVFVRRQRTLASPLLDLRLFGNRAFTAALVVQLLGVGVVGGIYLFITQYLQLVRGLPPVTAGLWLLPSALALVVASMLTPVIARRIRPGYILGGALVLCAIGFLVLTRVDTASGLAVLVVGFVIVYLGVSPTMVLGADLVIGTAPPEKSGSASAMSETSTELGVAVGIAVLGSVGTAVYREKLGRAIPPGVPDPVAEAARDGLASAADTPLADAAREAFTSGLTTVAGVAAALVAGLAAVVLLLFRRTEQRT